MIAAELIAEARAHLGAALAQALPSDDQIIMQHVRDAHDLLMAVELPAAQSTQEKELT